MAGRKRSHGTSDTDTAAATPTGKRGQRNSPAPSSHGNETDKTATPMDHNQSSSSPRKSTKPSSHCKHPTPSSKKNSPSKKDSPKKASKGSDPFHVKKKQLGTPGDPSILPWKSIIEVHEHVLAECFSSNTLPEKPSDEMIEEVEEQFQNAADPYAVLDTNMHMLNPNDRDASGLKKWRPNIYGPPDSLYNQLHEQVFMKTLEASFQYLANAHLTIKLYQNNTFSYWRNLWKKEERDNGSIQKAFLLNKALKCRSNRYKLRIDYQAKRARPKREQRLISERAAHSDDKYAPDGTLHILVMGRRSQKATSFIQELDHFIAGTQKLMKRCNAYKRIKRVPHPEGKISGIEGLPSPKSPIALPTEEVMDMTQDWMDLKLSDEEFMIKYGNEVHAKYKFPTEDKLFAMENGAISSDEEEEGNDIGDDNDNDGADSEDGADSKDGTDGDDETNHESGTEGEDETDNDKDEDVQGGQWAAFDEDSEMEDEDGDRAMDLNNTSASEDSMEQG
ncbi:hypothetical protein GYMLUDRAFT_62283 [Collybiopsis luxurians FD-317 M1]|uniref:Uncharacterized protein n=1 Tax=Collybiopsis luxurians FD-317 M1 TaxID=944289 RepID=A0A0D0BME1_9AGAR|nr:hypothetical protein GYMLUDRAFT_62283 [Collybiopsis luxurians FD-317 M1]